jgi:thiol-disulfide isomerase/thioredoxin
MKKIVIIIAFFAIAMAGHTQEIPKWKITDVENLMHSKNGEILVLNFWATFCKPCVAEIPAFIAITDRYKNNGVNLYLVSLDLPSAYPQKISSFAKQKKFITNISWLDETNADYFCPKVDNSWSGSIPATHILNTKTGYRKFVEGQMKADLFEEELKKALGN